MYVSNMATAREVGAGAFRSAMVQLSLTDITQDLGNKVTATDVPVAVDGEGCRTTLAGTI